MSKLLLAAFRRGFLENVFFARNAIVAHKLRASLTVLGIVIGVATVISMVSLVQGFNNNVTASFEAFGATLVQFQRFDPQFGPGNGRRDEEMRTRKVLTWEDAVISMERNGRPGHYGDRPDDAKIAFARICAHYYANGAFLDDGRLIREAGRLAGIPGVLIHGRSDRLIPPEHGQELAARIPGAQLTLIDDAGHFVVHEQPVAVAAAVDALLTRCGQQ